MCVCVCIYCSVTKLCLTLCNLMAHQVPLSIRFPRQEYWSGLPFPYPEDLPNQKTESLSSALVGRFLFIVGYILSLIPRAVYSRFLMAIYFYIW